MVGMAVSVLWFLIGLIILCGIIYLAIWVIESFHHVDTGTNQEGSVGHRLYYWR